ncbi:MAG: hypothetical protein ABSE92_01220 [Terriglobales bacterium]
MASKGSMKFPQSRIYRVAIVLLIVFVFAVGVLLWAAHRLNPWMRQQVINMLENRFDSEAEIQDLQVSLSPSISLHGTGLKLRHHGRTDVPPLIVIPEFWASESWRMFLREPWHLQLVKLRGLEIHMPPRGKEPLPPSRKTRDIPVQVDELISDDATLEILPNDPQKSPHVFLIHRLTMHSVGLGRSVPFQAALTNDTPPGEIAAQGQFGPWNIEDPRATPLSASYTFENADLGVFRGISGILSSEGKFGGILERIEVEGETTVPDFEVKISGHPMMLKTKFNATVDGTNGNTLLHPVLAYFGHSTLSANGGVVKAFTTKGREIVLDVAASNARLEDLIALGVKGDKPLMTGSVSLKTHFDLPPGDDEIVDRLKLKGQFGVEKARFTDEAVSEKVQGLSRRAQGEPKDEDAGSAVSALAGNFVLSNAVITFRGLSFRVTGARIQVDGTYGLTSENLDFHGMAILDAKPSQMVTGVKSLLLKPFDPVFRKEGKTQLPIKITGTRTSPSFGLELHKH